MDHRSQRGLALLCTTAALAGGSLLHVNAASAQAPPATAQLDLGLGLLLAQVTTGTVATVQLLLATLSLDTIGDLLVAADAAQLTKLLAAAAANGQLAGALATLTAPELATVVDGLTAGQTGDLLAGADAVQLTRLLGALTDPQLAAGLGTLDPAELTPIVSGLTPAQIGGVTAAGGSGSVITGLLGNATALAGTTPSPAQVDTHLGQLDALLAPGMPAQLTDLASLLTTTRSLLGTSGLDGAQLTALLTTVNGLVGAAPAPVAAPLQALATRLTELLTPPSGGGDPGGGDPGGGDPGGGGQTGGGGTTGGTTGGGTPAPTAVTTTVPATTSTTARPAVTAARPAATSAFAQPTVAFTAYRATLGTIKLNAKRTRMTFKLTCPATAPRGCAVTLNAKFAGSKAMRSMQLALPRATTTPVTVTISRSTTRSLKKKGGSLRISAKTAGSSLATATGTLKIKRLRKARKPAR